MKRLLVTAGGTATAWHICKTADEYFGHALEVHICDTNPVHLVPASVIAKKTHRVPASAEAGYLDRIASIVEEENIDCIIPLLPAEAFMLGADSPFISKLGIMSAAPLLDTAERLADKRGMYTTLTSLGIPTPKLLSPKEVSPEKQYIVKPRCGFGSRDILITDGETIRSRSAAIDWKENILQEYDRYEDYDEVTVEIFNHGSILRIAARRRLETKEGVCVKMEPVDSEIFYPYVKKMTEAVPCPIAFNVQFLRAHGEWRLFDCNLRLGAGTALSTALGFQLVRALLSVIAGDPVTDDFFRIDDSVKSVLRVYQEVVIR